MLKELLVETPYPTENLETLWKGIATCQRETYPNLIKLAKIALVYPVHTADSERGFSAQDAVKLSPRNRLSSISVETLLIIKLEGPDLKDFNFGDALL